MYVWMVWSDGRSVMRNFIPLNSIRAGAGRMSFCRMLLLIEDLLARTRETTFLAQIPNTSLSHNLYNQNTSAAAELDEQLVFHFSLFSRIFGSESSSSSYYITWSTQDIIERLS